MIEKFKTLFFVKSSLISLYLALTIPIPFISIEQLKILSIIFFILGLLMILDITNDTVCTCDEKIFYKTSFVSKIFGKKDWEISWKEIKFIKSLKTSQGSKVYYFITNVNENYLLPQRIEKFEKFVSIVKNRTELNINELTYLSPLWTYKLLTYLSILMIIGEIITFIS
tara:strand:- start:694 stop:1200 length:507 start_codon:yes stop_codon:yes gene_type:complete